MTDEQIKKEAWEKSARPMTWGRLKKIELVCVKPRS